MQYTTVNKMSLASPDKGSPRPISDYEFRLLRDHVHDYCGIYYDDSKNAIFASRVSFRMRLLDIQTYAEYYNYLKYNPGASCEMDDLIPHLTNNETYFFREMAQMEFFVSTLMEDIKARKKEEGERKIRIASCGCSTGEEAFTLAILLEEAGMYLRGWDIEIAGMDIDRKALEKAGAGIYTSYSLRAAEKDSINRYFETDGDKYRLKKRIKEKVSFHKGNLFDPEALAGLRHADAIFCRNVFIYLSDTAMRKIAEGFHDTLSGGGFLMLGHSESLSRVTDVFYPRRYPNVIVYSKEEGRTQRPSPVKGA